MCEGLAIHYLHLSTDTIIICSVRSQRCVGAGPCGPYNLSVFVTNHKSSPNSTRGQEQKDTRTSKPAKREQVFDNYNMAWAAQHTVVSADRGNAYFVWFWSIAWWSCFWLCNEESVLYLYRSLSFRCPQTNRVL